MTPRLLAEIAWQPVALGVGYGVYRTLPRTGAGRPEAILGAAIAIVALAWVPVTAANLAARIRHDARMPAAQVENAGAGRVGRVMPVIRRLQALIPPGDTYRFESHSSRITYWAYTSLLPRIEVGPGVAADWRVVWMKNRRATPPPGATPLGPGVWAIHTAT